MMPMLTNKRIAVSSIRDAREILSTMRKVIDTYKCATVSDFYDLCGLPSTFNDSMWGWRNLDEAKIVSVGNEFTFDLGPAERIEQGLSDEDVSLIVVGIEDAPITYHMDKHNPNWHSNSDFTELFVKNQENYFNDRLKHFGHVFLSEVFDAFGIKRSSYSIVAGWLNDGKTTIDFAVSKADDGLVISFTPSGVIVNEI